MGLESNRTYFAGVNLEGVIHIRDLKYMCRYDGSTMFVRGVTYRKMGVDIGIGGPYSAERRQPSPLNTIVNRQSSISVVGNKDMPATHRLTVVLYSTKWRTSKCRDDRRRVVFPRIELPYCPSTSSTLNRHNIWNLYPLLRVSS